MARHNHPSPRALRAILRLAVLSLLVLLGAAAWGLACVGAGDPEAALRRAFPDRAALVLDEGDGFEATAGGFVAASGAAPSTRAGLSATLPAGADGVAAFDLPHGLAVRVRERGLREGGAIVGRAVTYPRDGGASYWVATQRGYEEWLHLEAGFAAGDRAVATWEIEGAAVRKAGDAVELCDASGAARIVIRADVAYAASGRVLTPRLEARGDAFELWVDANGEEVLVDPSWVAGPALAVPRQRHTAALLNSGKVLIAGGGLLNGTGSVAAAEIYDPMTNMMSPAALMKSPRSQHAMAVLADGRVLVTGGTDSGGTPLASAEIYDPVMNTWTLTPAMSIARFEHTATTLLNGKVLVAGGTTTFSNQVSSAEIFDPTGAGSWAPAASLIGTRSRHAATLLLDGRVLVTGGYSGGGIYDTNLIYDPAASSWSPAFAMPGPRYFHAATRLLDGKVLIVGGETTIADVTGGAVYNPAVDFWTATGPTTAGGRGVAATLLANGTVLATGGGTPSKKSADIYDPATNTWSAGPPMAAARTHHTATRLVSGGVLVAAGYDSAVGNLTSTELFITGAQNGSPCAAANECSSGFCADGVCCNTACNAGPCDACSTAAGAAANGTCSLFSGVMCNDNNACTQVDTCQNGVCTGANPIVCPMPDSCHLPGTCDGATGMCSNPPKPNGTSCDDNNACTPVSTCQAGACTGQNPIVCPPPAACHTQGACDPATGMCSTPDAADGTPCDDGDACTEMDTCQSGACTGGAAMACPPESPCHDPGICDAATGNCTSVPKAPGASCDDGNPCTKDETCQGGACGGGTAVECPMADACHVQAACDPALGCPSVPKPNNTPCDDADACTQEDSCQSGVCVGGSLVVCKAIDACHEDGQCDAATGKCPEKQQKKPDGAACPEGECADGVCVPASSGPSGSGGAGGGGSGTGGGDAGESGGCGCGVSGSRAAGGLWVAIGLLLAARRRRRVGLVDGGATPRLGQDEFAL